MIMRAKVGAAAAEFAELLGSTVTPRRHNPDHFRPEAAMIARKGLPRRLSSRIRPAWHFRRVRSTLTLDQPEGTMDPATLAIAAISAALPYVTALGTEAAKAAGGGVGKAVWEWVKGKLVSEAGKEIVKDLESGPADVDNRKAAEATLSKFLRSDPNALADLARLLESAGARSDALTVTATHGGVAAGRDIRDSRIDTANRPKHQTRA
jgi:hypothetical protein